ncbi:fructosamine kinase family protein [Niabella insulamsoli]|uniref:fructosamine kinase family protein n=1 Tax=Niabella insulamsoli TaxID=3144874 RepID=UPI0031FE06CF
MQWDFLFEHLKLSVTGLEKVSGGDINEAFRVVTASRDYFLKVNDAARFPDLFLREAEGLEKLRACKMLHIPKVMGYGAVGGLQYLLLEWCGHGQPSRNAQQCLGAGLAALHRITAPSFGFETDNYIGSLPQINQPSESWPAFYAQYRILPLAAQLRSSGDLNSTDIKRIEKCCLAFAEIFPEEPPALLHGDLWSGNYIIGAEGDAFLIDPAVYFGHREMDIGMTRLFGGFSNDFYEAYHHAYPLQSGWQHRITYTQLYPLLVHALLFGGAYTGRVKKIISQF